MYIPKHFENTSTEELQDLIRHHPLGAWVTQADSEFLINHIPFHLIESDGPCGTLVGHVARANPVWKSFSRDVQSVVIFQGPQTYISPSWYPSKEAHGKVVPTWNYAVVHAYGWPRYIDDKTWLLKHVSQITAVHESGEKQPWRVSDAPAAYIDTMLKAIVGIEIPITRLIGKWKTSQNRPVEDRIGVIEGLRNRADDISESMAALIKTGET